MAALLNITQQAYSKMEKHEWIESKKMEEILILTGISKAQLEKIIHLKDNT